MNKAYPNFISDVSMLGKFITPQSIKSNKKNSPAFN